MCKRSIGALTVLAPTDALVTVENHAAAGTGPYISAIAADPSDATKTQITWTASGTQKTGVTYTLDQSHPLNIVGVSGTGCTGLNGIWDYTALSLTISGTSDSGTIGNIPFDQSSCTYTADSGRLPLNFLYRVAERPSANDHTQDSFLTLIDSSNSAADLTEPIALTSTSNVDGVQLGSTTVAFPHNGTITLPLSYTSSGATTHIIPGLDPSTYYKVATSGNAVTISVDDGTDRIMTDSSGVLTFGSASVPISTSPTISSFSASPTSITSGNSSTLSWATSDATSVSIDNGVGNQTATSSGSVSVSPTQTTTYTLTATNSSDTVTAQTSITVSSSSSGGGGGGGSSSSHHSNSSGSGSSSSSGSSTTAVISKPTAFLTQSLKYGMTGNEVIILQNFLISNNYLSSTSSLGTFGPKTKMAVQKFQCANNIVCYGTEITSGYGLVGPKTLAIINYKLSKTTTKSTAASLAVPKQVVLDMIATLLKQVAALQAELVKLQKGN